MGLALQLVTGFVTNPSSTFTALTINSGESATVPSFNAQQPAYLLAPFSPGVSAGVFRIRSPRLHDQAQGMRMQRAAAAFEPIMPLAALQPIYPSDALTVEITGGASETDMGAYLQFFTDLPGIAARLHTWPQISQYVRNLVGVEVDMTSGTVGAYGTARALNFSFDTLKANTDYAVLGFTVSAKVGVVCLYGPDTGNQHIGGPGTLVETETRQWFKKLSDESGLPTIPVINSNNRGSTFAQLADVGASTTANVTFNLAELAAGQY